ncbi:hypothetical protein BCR36DRAFT_583005 [Piromyces finnis]|uniref:C2H2-type domain-containing protein n=1 Tax=Piromyces finnis TaxID=1754191 RepID=A0A1Y1VAS0_9FUNG|nr:hypothetical protein BCR36DRAFT_583005 [Piromyces finnis]|eukprot:ORX51463.1 hypothetical protein BCR36DRAFT_583005 [Piromyces finnis]
MDVDMTQNANTIVKRRGKKRGRKPKPEKEKVKMNKIAKMEQIYLNKDIQEVNSILQEILNDKQKLEDIKDSEPSSHPEDTIKSEKKFGKDIDMEGEEDPSVSLEDQEHDPDEIVFKDENDRLKYMDEFNRKYNNPENRDGNGHENDNNYLNKIAKEAYSSVFLDRQIIRKRNTPINKKEFQELISECIKRNTPSIILKCMISKVDKERVESYKCPFPNCNKLFSKTHYTEYHNSNTDKNIRPFICHICKKTFRRRFDLTRHSNSHNVIKPYHCSRCLRGFARSDSCLRHIRMTRCQPFNFHTIPNDIDLFKLFANEEDSQSYVTVTPSITKDSFILLTFHQVKKENKNNSIIESIPSPSSI